MVKTLTVEQLIQLAKQYLQEGQYQAADDLFQALLQLKPKAIDNILLIAKSYENITWYKKAIEYYHVALNQEAKLASVHYAIGRCYNNLGKLQLAEQHLQQSIILDSQVANPYFSLGLVAYKQRQMEKALEYLQCCLKRQPQNWHTKFAFYVRLKEEVCDWQDRDKERDLLVEDAKNALLEKRSSAIEPFAAISLLHDEMQQAQISASWSKKLAEQFIGGNTPVAISSARCRVGYLSSDFYDHPTSHLISGMFQYHDKKTFEIFVYAYGEHQIDHYSEKIANNVEHFRDIRGQSLVHIAQTIHRDKLNILIDLKGYTTGAKFEIMALKLAPIQASYLGFPATTGADFIDYLIADKIVVPENCKKHYKEKIVYLPNCYQINDIQRAEPQFMPLPLQLQNKENFIFCCLHNAYKIEPIIFSCWMKILSQVPSSVLWLLETSNLQKQNLQAAALSQGINPKRLIFFPYIANDQHRARYLRADLALDTYYVNAHTTGSDLLWLGLPLLTCTSNTFAGRVATSLLLAIDLPELITNTLEDYIAQAVMYANNRQKLAKIRRKLQENKQSQPLFNTEKTVKDLERAYLIMWQRYLAGKPVDHIEVGYF